MQPFDIDLITLYVLQNGLMQVCNERDRAFMRRAFSPVTAEALDPAHRRSRRQLPPREAVDRDLALGYCTKEEVGLAFGPSP